MKKFNAQELKALFGSSDLKEILKNKEGTKDKPNQKAVSLEPKNISITKEEVKALAKKAGYVYQEGDENRVFEMTLTDETVDRYGDIVKADGIDTKNYLKNSVILPFHNSHTFPIGKMLKLIHDKESKRVSGWILIFQNSVDPTGASEVFYKMLKVNALSAGSIGFLPKEWAYPTEDDKKDLGIPDYGIIWTKWELLEFSICSVPANPNALQNAFNNKSLDREEVKKALLAAKEKNLEIPESWMKAIEAVSVSEKPVKKNLESWFETEENYIREVSEIEGFISETIKEKEIQPNPKISVLEGKLKENAETKIHSYIFPKSVWTLEKAQGYFVKKETDPTVVQTLIFDKEEFTKEEAVKWANDHDFRSDKVDDNENSYRLRQKDPGEFEDDSFKTIDIDTGIQAVIGNLKKKEDSVKAMLESMARQIKDLQESQIGKAGAVLSKKNIDIIQNAIKEIAETQTSLASVSSYLQELLNAAAKEDNKAASPAPAENAEQPPEEAGNKSLYDGDLQAEIKKLLTV